MIVTVMPTWQCTHSCGYCYLGSLRNKTQVASISSIKACLSELANSKHVIDKIVLTGGELSSLSHEYLTQLLDTCQQFGHVECETNLVNPSLFLLCNKKDIPVWISLNDERPKNYETKKLVEYFGNCNVQIVMLPSMLDQPSWAILDDLEELRVDKVRFIQYSESAYNDIRFMLTNSLYEDAMCDILKSYENKIDANGSVPYDIVNFTTDSVDFTSDDRLCIDPWGRFCVTIHSNGNKLSFKTFNSLQEYESWRDRDRITWYMCEKCNLYKKECSAENLSGTASRLFKETSCSGFPKLTKQILEFRKNYIIEE